MSPCSSWSGWLAAGVELVAVEVGEESVSAAATEGEVSGHAVSAVFVKLYGSRNAVSNLIRNALSSILSAFALQR